jgi:hypothetical protein
MTTDKDHPGQDIQAALDKIAENMRLICEGHQFNVNSMLASDTHGLAVASLESIEAIRTSLAAQASSQSSALVQEIVDAIAEAVKSQGSYTYENGGIEDMLDMPAWAKKISSMAPADAASVLRSVAHSDGMDVDPAPFCSRLLATHIASDSPVLREPGIELMRQNTRPALLEGDQPKAHIRKRPAVPIR